jgi:predicted membrane channel-forming protein YqfA (hemolysin III family)
MNIFKSRWHNTPKPLRITSYVILGILGVAAMGIVFGFGIMLLWNWLMPTLFGLGTITYWQGIGIFALAKLIFGLGLGGSSDTKSGKDKNDHTKDCDKRANWNDYDAWWEKEGKSAFEKYSGGGNNPESGEA